VGCRQDTDLLVEHTPIPCLSLVAALASARQQQQPEAKATRSNCIMDNRRRCCPWNMREPERIRSTAFLTWAVVLLLCLGQGLSFALTSSTTHHPSSTKARQRGFLWRSTDKEQLCASRRDGLQLSWREKQALVKLEFETLSADEIQKRLVLKGKDFLQEEQKGRQDGTEDPTRQSPVTRVKGCTATVDIQVVLRENEGESNGNDIQDSMTVEVHGTCDAMLSRGILSLWSNACQGSTASDILSLSNPHCLTDDWGLRSALSRGRNDGLASMVQTTQGLIRELLSGEEQETEKMTNAARDGPPEESKSRPNVALLLSGGVDSSVALNLLLRQGYDVTAFYLKIWLEDELAHLGQCPWEDDVQMCHEVCDQAGVPLEIINLQNEYKDRVISYTVAEAKQGRTPNPDIMCNSRIKFGCFYEAIEKRNFDFVATGHYAQVVRDTGRENGKKAMVHADTSREKPPVRLYRAPDPVKDQSYFLCALSQDQLQRVLFPIGHLEKSRVRTLANEFNLPNRHRPDSQGLCFLGKVKFEDFLKAYLGESPGDILDAASGELLGRHKGLWFHTVGQRKGIGKSLLPQATAKGPWYVVAKDPDRNIVFCSNQYDQEMFDQPRSEFTVESISWMAGGEAFNNHPPGTIMPLLMKIRHGPRLVQGSLEWTSSTTGKVRLDHKDGGLAPGQYVVFYNEDAECLGGGVISEKHWAHFLLSYEQQLRVFKEDPV